ncbi:MAG: hypothetical protein ACT452_05790 [Microthrixaceae bacterium]
MSGRRGAHEHAAVGDCERIRPGLIGQPANTLSSLAFVAAAVPLARRGRGWRWVAAATAFEGLGSVGYHGPGGRVAKAMHDLGLVAMVATAAAAFAADPGPPRVRPHALALAMGAVVLHSLSRTGGPLCSCNSRLQGHALFHLLAAAALASAPPR